MDNRNFPWEALIEDLPAAVGVIRADGQIILVNRRWREIHGSPPAGMSVAEHARRMKSLRPDRTPIPDDELPGFIALRTGNVVRNFESIIQQADGNEIPALASAAPIRDEQGRVVAAAVVFDDLSEYKQMQRLLAKGQRDVKRQAFLLKFTEALRPVADSSRILELATGMLCDHFNADHVSYCQMEKTGSFYTILHDHHRADLPALSGRHDLKNSIPRFAAALKAGKTIVARDIFAEHALEKRQLDLYTRQRLTAFVTVPLVKDGRLVAFLRVQFEQPHEWRNGDVPLIEEVAERTWAAVERAQAEDVMKKALARLESRTQELDAVIASIPDGLVIYDCDINPIYLNEAARQFFERYKIPYQEDFSVRARKGVILNEEGRRLEKEEWAIYRAFANGETIRDFIQMSPGQDGQPYYTSVSCAPIHDEKGRISGAVATLKDITQQKQAEIQLRESEQRARALVENLKTIDQNRSHFIRVLSHELRNPLASIVLSQSLIKQVSPDSARGRRAWEAMERQTGVLTRLVDDLLDVTRISENKIKLKLERTDLGSLIGRTLADSQAAFDEKGVALELALPARPLSLDVDPVRVTQMIGNLLHNAYKFTHAGDHVQVSLNVDEHAGEAVIRVRDTGLGIEPKILRHLFEPFTQADQSLARTEGGLGLGLSIVKGMAELHGGHVEATSDGPGKGASFSIHLPLGSAAAPAGHSAGQQAGQSAGQPAGQQAGA